MKYIINNIAIVIFTISAFTIVVYVIQKWIVSQKKEKITFDNAKNTLDRIHNWTTWMTGIQTAAIGSMGYLCKDKTLYKVVTTKAGDISTAISYYSKDFNLSTKGFALLSAIFFGISIILSTTIFSSLASIQQRLCGTKDSGDQYEDNDVFLTELYIKSNIIMGRILTIVHLYFIIGLTFFALFIYTLV